MKTLQKFLILFNFIVILISGFNDAFSQQAKMSFSSAYNMLNGGNKSTGSGSTSGTMQMGSVSGKSYNNKITITYGIPIEIVMEYAVLKTNLSSDMALNSATYDNSSPDIQQAFDNIAYGNFVKISDYNQVNVKLNFRFNPPVLRVYGSDEGDFVNSAHSSPYDPGVYITPNTPVRGSKIMVIKK
jgi:hypothetical protein